MTSYLKHYCLNLHKCHSFNFQRLIKKIFDGSHQGLSHQGRCQRGAGGSPLTLYWNMNYYISLGEGVKSSPSFFYLYASLNTFELSYFSEGGGSTSSPSLSMPDSSQNTFELSYFTKKVELD